MPANSLQFTFSQSSRPDVAARLSELAETGLDLLVLTHVDGDHIEGTILLVNDAGLELRIGEVWCNGSHHLVSELGPVQGEILGALIGGRGIGWNASFAGAAIVTSQDDPFPVIDLAGHLRVTVLAPDSSALRRLRDAWLAACREAGLGFGSAESALLALRSKPMLSPKASYLGPAVPDVRQLARSRTGSDKSVANASSLVLLVGYGASRVLLAGDSTPAALTPPIRRLLADRELPRSSSWSRSSRPTSRPASKGSRRGCPPAPAATSGGRETIRRPPARPLDRVRGPVRLRGRADRPGRLLAAAPPRRLTPAKTARIEPCPCGQRSRTQERGRRAPGSSTPRACATASKPSCSATNPG